MPNKKRRTPDEIYEAAVEKLAKARDRNATILNLGDRRLSLTRLPPLDGLPLLKSLTLSQTGITDLSGLRSVLDLGFTEIKDITSLSGLHELESLNLAYTKVADLMPLRGLTKLQALDISQTNVRDLSPLAAVVSLWEGAKSPWHFFSREGGISFKECPISDPKLKKLASYKNPRRTRNALDHLRELQGLPKLRETKAGASATEAIQPVENVPAPYTFELNDSGTISLSANPANWPTFPFRTSERDHAQRLDVCRTLANDLLADLKNNIYQAREEYSRGLQKYGARLPERPGEGNILLADAEARTLRNLFAAEADILSTAFASKLKTFLEQHMGLRVFYPEIANFYRDLRTGHLKEPLPLDAVEGFVQGIQNNTPAVFEPTVSDAIQGTAEPPVVIPASDRLESASRDTGQPMPPPDPLGDVDPERAWDFTFAGTANGLWRAFLEGSKVYKAAAAWKKAGDAIAPHAQEILKWLHDFMNSSGGSPH
ncbi:MAG TPA: leucine-rich repeat domain-containing protein [Rhizomicrobium sp.]|nr:leucine-rich repeat domain-containing protein [Rhizomicrobium sp.]